MRIEIEIEIEIDGAYELLGGGGGMEVDERVLCPVGGPWRGLETPPGKPPLNFLSTKTKSIQVIPIPVVNFLQA